MEKKYTVAVAGMGYVGLSMAVLLYRSMTTASKNTWPGKIWI